MKTLIKVTFIWLVLFLMKTIAFWYTALPTDRAGIQCNERTFTSYQEATKKFSKIDRPCILLNTWATNVVDWRQISIYKSQRLIRFTKRNPQYRYTKWYWNLNYDPKTSLLISADRTISITKRWITREYYTNDTHVRETVSSCRTGYEYTKNLKNKTQVSVDRFTADVQDWTNTYKTNCLILIVNWSY